MNGFLSRRQLLEAWLRVTAGSAVAPLLARLDGMPAPASPGRRANLAAQFDRLEELIGTLMKEGIVPGASVAVIRDAAVAWHRSFGVRDAASGAPADDRTVFEAASVSKTVFAYAVMQLCDRGVLDLDTPLTHYTRERILDGDPRLERITARHVLSHTSGLPNFRSGAEPLRIAFTPGTKYQYSGEGYWYLQSVVTHLTGTVDPHACATYEAGMQVCASDIDVYLGTNVLEPCGMRASGYVWNDAFEQHAARPHDTRGQPLPLARPTRTDAARYAAMGGLCTTALDYAHFLMEVMAPRAPAPYRLSIARRDEMIRPQVEVDDTKSWALGWEVERIPGGVLIEHQGGQRGAQAFAAASVDRRSGYVILTNGDNGWKVFFDKRFVTLINAVLFS